MNDLLKNEPASFAQEVWDTLSKLDVADHVQELPKTGKRPAIQYLPWHSAWYLLKRNFPASTYHHEPDLHHLAESVEVEVKLFISGIGTEVVTSSARLPVMDSRFNAILSPDARAINDSRQRCLVKACAFAGLGLNLWTDSAMPVGKLADPINSKQVKIIDGLIERAGLDIDLFLEWLGVDAVEYIPHEAYAKAKVMLESKLS